MHPLHPMLVHFPIAFLTTSALADIISAKYHHRELASIGRLGASRRSANS